MLAPSWLTDGLAAVMLFVSAYCASRLVLARLAHRATHYSFDAVHALMGVAMAAMLTSRIANPTPWVVLFVVAAGWFGLRATGGLLSTRLRSGSVGSPLRHLVSSAAMVYMLSATPAAAATPRPAISMGAASAGRSPTLALAFAVLLIGYAVTVADRMSRPPAAPDSPDPILAPRTVACCQIAMNVTMGYMLATLL